MKPMPPFTWGTLFSLILVAGCATAVRIGYIAECCQQGKLAPALLVQGPPLPAPTNGRQPRTLNTVEQLAANLAKEGKFASRAPLADKEETTAHVAPGYPLLFAALISLDEAAAPATMRWLQCVLGSLTAVCYFFFARRAFHSTLLATLAGLLTAFHPFWIVNTAELNDGVLAGFFVAVVLALGTRGVQVGGASTGLAFGIALAGAALVRGRLVALRDRQPALVPLGVPALAVRLAGRVSWRCIGFVNALALWA